jgi:predicted alpha/beta-hydrolase family hydrolase
MLIVDGETHAKTCIFAHGAGAPMDSEFMQRVAKGLANLGIKVVRFEFPYMQERRLNGKKRPPNRQPELIESFAAVLAQQSGPCVLMGKSMGGRMASILASEQPDNPNILGVLALGYPFHPQGKPEKLRIAHLPSVKVPMAVVQGTRDALGNQDEVRQLPIPSSIEFLWLEDGDHDLKPRVKSGFTHQQHIDQAIQFCADFIKRCY